MPRKASSWAEMHLQARVPSRVFQGVAEVAEAERVSRSEAVRMVLERGLRASIRTGRDDIDAAIESVAQALRERDAMLKAIAEATR